MFRNQNFKPGSPGYLTDTLSEWERPQKRKIRRAIELPKCSDKLKNVLVVQFNFPGVVQAKSPPNSGQGTYYVYSAHSFKFSVDTESNFQLILNQISPPGNPHWHWQHCEPYPAAKEHTSWYNDVNKSLIYLQLTLPQKGLVSSQPSNLLIQSQLQLKHCLGPRGEQVTAVCCALPTIFLLVLQKTKWNVLRCWAILDSERVSVKWLVVSGSKFWFRNTPEKIKWDPYNRF